MYQTQDRVKQTARQTDERRAITTIHAYYSQICVNSIKYFWQTGCSIIVNRDASLSQIPDTIDDYFRNTLKVELSIAYHDIDLVFLEPSGPLLVSS